VIENLNSFNNVVIQFFFVDIEFFYEDKCISLLCSFPDSWDIFVVSIGSNATTLKFYDVVSFLLLEAMRRKTIYSQRKDSLIVRGCFLDRNKNNSLSGKSKSRGRSKSLGKY
jgi:hypothetical protein